ncbi:ABC transporter permease [Candidatus Sumerlaeota bacterium]|nr:ABC transporter permease [Candidatus Sumerlaeota bacterium]
MSATASPAAVGECVSSQPKASWRQRHPALARFARNRVAVAAAVMIVLIFSVAIFGPMIHRTDPGEMNLDFIGTPQGPGKQFPLGSDAQGRDMLARLLAGARISLSVGVVSCFINILIGVGVGVMAGWASSSDKQRIKAIDTLLMRSVDILQSLPLLLVVIIMQITVKNPLERMLGGRTNVPLIFSPDLLSIYFALGITNWLTMSRLSRGEVMNQARLDYVLAARSLGQKSRWILIRHIIPNCVGPIAVAATLAIPEAIFIESFLGYVGLGISAPQASWGTMASDGLGYVSTAPQLLIMPAVAISITMLAFNLFGDGLRDALDPSTRG